MAPAGRWPTFADLRAEATGILASAAPVLRQMGFLGFALTEALALFAFVLAILILLNVL